MKTILLSLFAVSLLLFGAASGRSAEKYAGNYQGDGLSYQSQGENGSYTGTLTLEGQTFNFTGQEKDQQLQGSFVSTNGTFDFTATLKGDALEFISGDSHYTLLRQDSNPLAKPTRNTESAQKSAEGNPLVKKLEDHARQQGRQLVIDLLDSFLGQDREAGSKSPSIDSLQSQDQTTLSSSNKWEFPESTTIQTQSNSLAQGSVPDTNVSAPPATADGIPTTDAGAITNNFESANPGQLVATNGLASTDSPLTSDAQVQPGGTNEPGPTASSATANASAGEYKRGADRTNRTALGTTRLQTLDARSQSGGTNQPGLTISGSTGQVQSIQPSPASKPTRKLDRHLFATWARLQRTVVNGKATIRATYLVLRPDGLALITGNAQTAQSFERKTSADPIVQPIVNGANAQDISGQWTASNSILSFESGNQFLVRREYHVRLDAKAGPILQLRQNGAAPIQEWIRADRLRALAEATPLQVPPKTTSPGQNKNPGKRMSNSQTNYTSINRK